MLLKGPKVQLIPHDRQHWQYLARWFYESAYRDMWRHLPRALTQQDFENYPQLINGQVFFVMRHGGTEPIGFTQIIPDCKTNRAFFAGLLIDKQFQKKLYPAEVFSILFDYAFNRWGYQKAIVEVCETNESLNKLLRKMNFTQEGVLHKEAFLNGEFINEVRYCMMAADFNRIFKPMVETWVG